MAGAGFGTSGTSTTFGIKENNYMGNGLSLDTKLDISEESIKGKFSLRNPNYQNTDKSIFTNIEAALKIAQPSFLDPGTEFVFYPSEDDAAYQTAEEIDKTTDFTTYLNDGFSFNAALIRRWRQRGSTRRPRSPERIINEDFAQVFR